MQYQYRPSGVCSRQITIDVENGVVQNVSFVGGCNGNLQGIGALVKGMKIEDVIARLEHIPVSYTHLTLPTTSRV